MRQLTLEVQQAFVELQAAKESLQLARANQQTFEELVAINAARVRAGDLAPIELVRTRVSAIQLNQAVIQAETPLARGAKPASGPDGASRGAGYLRGRRGHAPG